MSLWGLSWCAWLAIIVVSAIYAAFMVYGLHYIRYKVFMWLRNNPEDKGGKA